MAVEEISRIHVISNPPFASCSLSFRLYYTAPATICVFSFFCLFVVCLFFLTGCGQRPGVRIIGGSTATPNSWLWQLSLRVMGVHSCGASLISPKWAVTASHCVDSYHDPHVYSLVAR